MTLSQTPQIYGGLSQLGIKTQQAVTPWWLSGGVSASNAVAAYQPKGAASQAASYSNLANPGTYDAAPGVAPTWDSTSGWKGSGTQWLNSGVSPGTAWSMVVRFSNASPDSSNTILAGMIDTTAPASRFYIAPRTTGVIYANGAISSSIAPSITSGVLAVVGQYGYRNGALDTGPIATDGTRTRPIYIMCTNRQGVATGIMAVYIQAMAIYDIVLTAPQVLAISTAMAAL